MKEKGKKMYKGSEWRKETLKKRKRIYAIVDILLAVVWLIGTLAIALSVLTLYLTHNWQLPLIGVVAGLILWFIVAALDHGTISGRIK